MAKSASLETRWGIRASERSRAKYKQKYKRKQVGAFSGFYRTHALSDGNSMGQFILVKLAEEPLVPITPLIFI